MAMNYSNEVLVECSWKVENLDDVRNKILWREKPSELTEETGLENCFMISQPDSTSGPCTLKLTLQNRRKFSALQILSEVPLIEVYGIHEEYLSTVRGEHLDEIEGSSLYECKIGLKELQSEILLKFCKLTGTSLWVYGIAAVTKLTEVTQSLPTHLPADQPRGVNQLISTMMMGLSQNKDPNNTANFSGFEILVDKKLKEMEERMMNKIDERLRKLEIKMDDNHGKLVSMLCSDKKINNL